MSDTNTAAVDAARFYHELRDIAVKEAKDAVLATGTFDLGGISSDWKVITKISPEDPLGSLPTVFFKYKVNGEEFSASEVICIEDLKIADRRSDCIDFIKNHIADQVVEVISSALTVALVGSNDRALGDACLTTLSNTRTH